MQFLLVLLLLVWPTVQRKAGRHYHVAEEHDDAIHDSCLIMKDCPLNVNWGKELKPIPLFAKLKLKKALSGIGISTVGMTNVKMWKTKILHTKYGKMKLFRAKYEQLSELCTFEFGHCIVPKCLLGKASTRPVCGPPPSEQEPTTSKPVTLPPEPEPTNSEPEQTTPCPECDTIP